MKRIYLIAAAALLASTFSFAQDKPADSANGQHRGGGNPIFAALDTNHDGELDANEISNAPVALRKLDKNGDGKLTRDELRPARQEGGKKGKNKNK